MGGYTGGGGGLCGQIHLFARARRTCAEDSDPQDVSKSAENLYSGVFWGVESKNDLRFDFWIDGWAVRLIWKKMYFEDLGPDFEVSEAQTTRP